MSKASKPEHEATAQQEKFETSLEVISDAKPSDKHNRLFEIDIFKGWCKSCGICVAFCPRECIAFDEDGDPVVQDAERCTGCGWCEVHCPDFAISVRPKRTRKIQPEE